MAGTTRVRVGSGTPWESAVGYSRALRVGPHVWVSGTTAEGETAEAQTRAILAKIADALATAGAGLEDVVRTRSFVTDIADWEAVGRVHGEVFGEIRPAATLVAVSALVDPALRVEIEVEAYVAEP